MRKRQEKKDKKCRDGQNLQNSDNKFWVGTFIVFTFFPKYDKKAKQDLSLAQS
jgi:hypothetical protein